MEAGRGGRPGSASPTVGAGRAVGDGRAARSAESCQPGGAQQGFDLPAQLPGPGRVELAGDGWGANAAWRVHGMSLQPMASIWCRRSPGVSLAGERFEGDVPGPCELRDGKLARARMSYFDPVAVAGFRERAQARRPPAPVA
jgi:hypothetical protein